MKTLILKDTKVSIYLFEDKTKITFEDNRIIVGNLKSPDFYIGDCNINNSEIVENVIPPIDWVGGKYIYDKEFILIEPIKFENKILG